VDEKVFTEFATRERHAWRDRAEPRSFDEQVRLRGVDVHYEELRVSEVGAWHAGRRPTCKTQSVVILGPGEEWRQHALK
jgi:hypothetical protein